MSAVAWSQLTPESVRARGEPAFFETSSDAWKAKLVGWYEAETGRTLYPDQTEMFLIEMLAYAFALMGEEGQAAALQNLMAYATGRHLDDVANNVAIVRQEASRALTTLRFNLVQPSPAGTLIPKGTIAAAGNAEFRTIADCLIAEGASEGEVTAEAVVAGPAGNGFLPGQITTLKTTLPAPASVRNLTVSGGGAAREDDERLAFRGYHAFDRVDRRGGWAGYGQFVFDVSPAITDVAVFRRAPCVIEIVALTGRVTAAPDVNQAIEDALHPETVRPQGDDLHVCTATAVIFDIVIRVRSNRDVEAVRAAVETSARAAFEGFKRPAVQPKSAVQFSPTIGILGARVSPSPLHAAAIAVDGVIDAEVEGITYADLPWYELTVLGSLTVILKEAPDA
ncbi:Phage-related baseplate assembly protein [Fulvimarina manganoxydans]|uniref:Phage-related baseplate assembly protein n=1 Tax=Fulvimarina manganoxydans TaxID=937218 RepID=A0A1W2CW87_9HYPH|nr:baseplate J/gp47 family protein [Fulvimarina manganoxydans]SMC89216.1 Phage-related baseplate assembly protein [Fulvimarina manganoxydans]